jgi:hypothetical protein
VKIAVELYPQLRNQSGHVDFDDLTQNQKMVWQLVAEVYQKNTGVLPDRVRQVFELVKTIYVQCSQRPNAMTFARKTLEYVLHGNEDEVGLLDLFTHDRSYFSQWFMAVLTASAHEPKVAYYLAHHATDFVADIIEVTLFSFCKQFIARVGVDGSMRGHPAVRFLVLMYTATVKVFKDWSKLSNGSEVLDASFIAKKSKYSPKTSDLESFERSPVQQIMLVELAKKNRVAEVASSLETTFVHVTRQQFFYRIYKHIMSSQHWTVLPDFARLLTLDMSDFDVKTPRGSYNTPNEMPDLKREVLDPMEKALGGRYLQVFMHRKLGEPMIRYMFDMCIQVAVLEGNFIPLLKLVHGRLNAAEQFCNNRITPQDSQKSNIANRLLADYHLERHLYEGSGSWTSRVKSVRNFIQQSLFGRESSNDIMLWKETLRNAIQHATGIYYKPDKIQALSSDEIESNKKQAQNTTVASFNTLLRRYLAELDDDWPQVSQEKIDEQFMAQLTHENDSSNETV